MTPRVALILALFSFGSWIEIGARTVQDILAMEQKMRDPDSEWNPRVIGGREALDKEFPWMVSLHYKHRFVCSSFLITPKVLMTAAHCVVFGRDAEPADLYNAYCGNLNRDGPVVDMRFTEIIAHKQYGSDTEYDIALLKLDKPVDLSDEVQPICLPKKGSTRTFDDSIAVAMGWGVYEKGGRESSQHLMTIPQHVPKISDCQRVYRILGIPVTERHTCAGGEDNGICFGDSGGPLVSMNGTKPVAIGIASFGSYLGCAVRRVPAVYTCTDSYYDWIQESLGEDAKDLCYA